jgi:predicted transglutaminase-like cysteine proteinase
MVKTTTATIKRVNAETGEEIVRDMNETELAQLEADKVSYDNAVAAYEARAIAKSSLLKKLGITEDEAKLLLS